MKLTSEQIGYLRARYATVPRDGYSVPLIGIPANSVEERCDLCGDIRALREIELQGRQFLCAKCRR